VVDKPINETTAIRTGVVLVMSDADASTQLVRDGYASDQPITLIEDSVDGFANALQQSTPSALILLKRKVSEGLLELIGSLAGVSPVPIIVFVDVAEPDEARAATRAGASAFIVDGLSATRVKPVVDVAIERFKLTAALQEELQKSKEDLAARKTIERAKGLLMERRNLSEQDAYDAMRKMAMAQGKPLKEIASTILSISDLLP